MKLGSFGAIALPAAAVAITVGTATIPLTANASSAKPHAGATSAKPHAGATSAKPHAGATPTTPTRPTAVTGTHSAASAYALYDCANKPQVRPGTFDIACDGADSLAHLKWSEWDGSRAVGSGVDWVDNCTPNCAAGKFFKQNVIVILWRPEAVHGHKGKFGYSKLTLLFPGTGKIQDGIPPGLF